MSMNILEEAVIYATIMHQGKVRKGTGSPYILHPLEVAQIISTITDDVEVITAGVLHDIVEDTDGTLGEIQNRFGDRVAELVSTETENKYEGQAASDTWRRRKEDSLKVLKNCGDNDVRILWLADKLSNIRSLAQMYGEKGTDMWEKFNMSDPDQQLWYYRSIAEEMELYLNKTGAFKEFVKHINYMWPGTFVSEKTKFQKYNEYSVDGCEIIGRGAKGNVYRYNDELAIKVYNENNTFKEIEREIYLARQAFIAGVPTAISFGIVSVGKSYGSMFELLDSQSISKLISRNSGSVKYYAKLMANTAKSIHETDGSDIDCGDFTDEVYKWIDGGLALVDDSLTEKVTEFVDSIPRVNTLIHGDFHTGNVMIQDDEPLLIDMDRLSKCHPIVELSGLYMFYVGFGEYDATMIENFMGFSRKTAGVFFREFMKSYLGTDSAEIIQRESDRAALLCYTRLIRRIYKKGRNLTPEAEALRDTFIEKIRTLLDRVEYYE